MIKINIPKEVKEILEKLNDNGYEAYIVGGCVRDCVLGMKPEDWDITTSAFPNQVKQLFRKTIDTGLKHGTVTVLVNHKPYEVTTYRIDGVYENNRKPVEVSFTTDIVDDLRRRDFTINAMAYNEREGLLDAFSGLEDLNRKVVRCVGDPNERFNEDALRMLRAIRFSAKLDFSIEASTKEAIRVNAALIKNISGERIHMELTKILTSNHPNYIERLVDYGLMKYIIPEFIPNVDMEQQNIHHIYRVDQHTYNALNKIDPTETLRWTMLLHDIGKGYSKKVDEKGVGHFYGHSIISVNLARDILNRLRFDNKTTSNILKLIEYHDYRIEPKMMQVRKAINKIGVNLFESYLKVQKADILAQNPIYHKEYLAKLEEIYNCYQKVIQERQCTTLKELNINGKDLTDMGIKQGKVIGKILNQLLEFVIEEPERNDRDWLLDMAKKLHNWN